MRIEQLKQQLPSFAKDLKINLGNIFTIDNLSEQQLWGTLYACALTSGNSHVREMIETDAKQHLNEQAIQAVQAAVALMGMNNIYYRFIHLIHDESYQRLPANLRMTFIANPGVDSIDFELWSLAVSAINGCGLCMDSHEKVLRKQGVTQDIIQNVIRIAAIVNGVARAVT